MSERERTEGREGEGERTENAALALGCACGEEWDHKWPYMK